MQTCIYIYYVYLYTVMYSKFGFGSLFGNGTGGGEHWKGASPLSKKQTKTYVRLLASISPCFAVWEKTLFAMFGRWNILLVFAALWARIPALVFVLSCWSWPFLALLSIHFSEVLPAPQLQHTTKKRQKQAKTTKTQSHTTKKPKTTRVAPDKKTTYCHPGGL